MKQDKCSSFLSYVPDAEVAENGMAVHSSKSMFSARLPPVFNLVFYVKSLTFRRLGGLMLRAFTDTIQVQTIFGVTVLLLGKTLHIPHLTQD